MQLAEQLHNAGLNCFPCRKDKAPAIPKGTSWADESKKHPSEHQWGISGVVGVPVPQGIVIIDLDVYKGVTREQVEQALGCQLDWNAAQIQTTQSGGQHYAFRCTWPVTQGSNIAGIKGLDTRCPGKGYIATGAGYYGTNLGVLSLAAPYMLPELPEQAKHVLELVEREKPTAPASTATSEQDIDTVKQALAHIEPDCGRSEWVSIGLALRSYFQDDEYTGQVIFDEWSSGVLGNVDQPVNYAGPEDSEHQFYSFGVEGGTTIATLFHKAIAKGWNPPRTLNTALAFGPGAASEDAFGEMVDRIIASGGDPKAVDQLVADFNSFACNDMQRSMLKATLMRELKDADLLTKEIKQILDGGRPKRPPGVYGSNHTENASQFLADNYPDTTLLRSDQVWYAYDGKSWVELDDDYVRHEVAMALAPSFPQASVISGTVSMMADLCTTRRKIGDVPDHLVIVQNGVLDLNTGSLAPHDMAYFTTNILPYSYNPYAQCHDWDAFLDSIFEGDEERKALLQEWFGYMMANSYDHQKIMLLVGPKRCGKGTIGRVLNMLVGDENFSGGTLISMANDAFIESLVTKTVMFIGDAAKKIPGQLGEQVTERFKNISGGDKIPISRKYKSTISPRIPTRMTIASNHVPRLFDDSGALASRLLVIPFDVSFLDREDFTLFDRLQKDIEGIAMWSLQGLARLKQNKRFTQPSRSASELQDIKESFSPLNTFIDSQCRLGNQNDVISGADIYETYRAWCVTNSEDTILARRQFTSTFRDGTRGKGVRYGTHSIDAKPVKGFRGVRVLKEIVEAGTTSGSIPLTAIKGGKR